MTTTTTSPEWTSIGTFNRLSDAQELEAFLQGQGVTARVYDERSLQRFWFWVHPKAGIHVQVGKSQVEEAEKLFQAMETLWMRAVRCPECGSSRVQYPAVTRKNMLPAILDHVFTFVGLFPAAYFCESCQYTWTRPHRDSIKDLKSPSSTLTSKGIHSN
jgi:transposase-like protein